MPTVMRWFGVLRKRSGQHVFASAPADVVPDQSTFLKSVLKQEPGDTVVDLLQSDVWQPKDFHHYANAEYIKKDKVPADGFQQPVMPGDGDPAPRFRGAAINAE